MKIDHRVFFITGGASGLGAATACMLIAAGGRVAIADLNREKGEALATELGSSARFIATDVANEASGRAAVDATLSAFGALHGLIACAGIAPAEKVLGKGEPPELALFAKVVQINLIGAFNLTRHAATAMARNEPTETGERGVIINTASIAAFEAQVGQAAYAASKGGVVAMTLPIARELSRYGIRVMAIAPGVMETPMLLDMPQAVQDSLD
ncbi:MAG: SDR family NAD(P)-dependent oxidoreductase, partial [Candidatus Competibacteraceae bacterium]|nr:SDR family NAD(P)-dependent oxidoreductase [Candidatus Competibacteraceae bacterium]